ncbi:MAG TPA: 4'-phosphopantetheinyl transferase superfamily protein [Pseudoxanthomonas sp.]
MLRNTSESAPADGEFIGRDLGKTFAEALPSPDWPSVARGHALVALFQLGEWKAWLPQAAALLDAAELVRVERRRRQKDRDSLTLAYALHRLFLGTVLEMEAAVVPLGRDESGCPRLAGLSASTSLSHADDYVALAVCLHGPVGVDIEPRSRLAVMPEIAARVCHPDESARLRNFEGIAYGEALLALWVRKEALLKAAGVGLAREMTDFPAPEGESLPLDGNVGASTRLHMLEGGGAAVAALAAPHGIPIHSAWVRLNPMASR